MKNIILESNPAFILLCVAIAVGYAYVLYTAKHPWSGTLNKILFGVRTVLVFLLAFLLLGPIIRQINNLYEKPVFVILQDNSVSVKETTDSVSRNNLQQALTSLKNSLNSNGYEAFKNDLTGEEVSVVKYTEPVSDLQGALRKISNQYEGQQVAGVLLVSDGIYNSGLSPLYTAYSFPVYTLGVGDTAQRQDISIKELIYNKIAYQGNQFPIRAEVLVKGFPNQNITVSLVRSGKVIDRQTKNSGTDQLLPVEFKVAATEQGLQRLDVQVEVMQQEKNVRNNKSTAFIDVVEGRKKILVVASAPHPDIKALRAIVDKNSNYEFILHIPGVEETETKNIQPANVDLAIFHQSPDKTGRTRDLFQRFAASKTSMLVVVGQQTDLKAMTDGKMPLAFDQPPRQYDDVMPVISPTFPYFLLSPEANSVFSGFPPVWVPFGRMQVPASAVTLLSQRVGSIATDKSLLWIDIPDNHKIAIMLGEGFWQWRLEEYSKNENTEAFDEVFGKLIQYLSTTDDKSRFKSYPLEQQFSDTEAVVFESQVYNEIYEPVFGNRIDLEITDDAGKKFKYNYVVSPGNARYQVGGLKEGIYKYTASTSINGKEEKVRGQFLVTAQQAELQNLTADFGLLRKLAGSTGGKFYTASQTDKLNADLTQKEATSVIHSEEKFDNLLNLKWVFFLLLALISAEWFLRKYHGGY
ncbi:MAG TPA: hypothetical protein PK325_01235 [Cyclobacteriaceae bacterium]|nr:hypothetical protein [Cyclobacteriaceae bacterium]HMV08106.1 hypothetical protein [Cyclobacteriaceae bacterium]HMV88320.1 hypothetical protein [Cyclobacteriaceae bacterium]HMX00747.1 hypothetical protein [Cyclobacteriaceae bacterium]HMX49378.1 hypothetical protein [Cyclobacteriaceae bacterium]